MTPEGRVKNLLRKQFAAIANAIGRDVRKMVYVPNAGRYGSRGEPDFRITIAGCEIHVEAKADNGRLSPTQKDRIEELRDCGALVFVVKGEDEAANFVADHVSEIIEHLGPRAPNGLTSLLKTERAEYKPKQKPWRTNK